ncbi:MAG: phosphatidylserine decarboxylase family protein [Bacteroidales bacterium]|jgi:phosphatidylserine decarboxylase|nr:phosphatidylserine decarboxylase family protein [Bacteroidales bacterium]
MIPLYKIHKEGIVSIFIAFLIAFIPTCIILYFFDIHLILKLVLLLSGLIFWCLIVFFFRVPYRKTNQEENAIVSPADGTIVQILEEIETEYFKEKKTQISIFMSPLNVHVNTYPIEGEVVYVKYHKGKHRVASLPKASKDNEHNTVVQRHKNGTEILFRQIAGTVARRIVSYTKEGFFAKQGDEMGIIKFGSRVDVFLPLTAKINVKINHKVKSKITHLAYFS